jgi:hypothetical protein
MSDIPVKVTCLTPPGTAMKGRLHNLSAHGLSVIISRQLATGSAIKVEWGSSEFVGELVHCRPHGKEYLAGLTVAPPVYDTKKAIPSSKSLT